VCISSEVVSDTYLACFIWLAADGHETSIARSHIPVNFRDRLAVHKECYIDHRQLSDSDVTQCELRNRRTLSTRICERELRRRLDRRLRRRFASTGTSCLRVRTRKQIVERRMLPSQQFLLSRPCPASVHTDTVYVNGGEEYKYREQGQPAESSESQGERMHRDINLSEEGGRDREAH
jgi:hypothetical protein